MRVAFIVTSFPNVSATFILDKITGLIERGHEVILSARALPSSHDDITTCGFYKSGLQEILGSDALGTKRQRLPPNKVS